MPECKICKASEGTEFPLFLLPPGFKFGEICAPCLAYVTARAEAAEMEKTMREILAFVPRGGTK